MLSGELGTSSTSSKSNASPSLSAVDRGGRPRGRAGCWVAVAGCWRRALAALLGCGVPSGELGASNCGGSSGVWVDGVDGIDGTMGAGVPSGKMTGIRMRELRPVVRSMLSSNDGNSKAILIYNSFL